MMSEQFCACGNIDGTNTECERCRLIAALTAAQQRVAELEQRASIVRAQLGNIEWNLQRQNNPTKEDWQRMVRHMMETLKND